jgi:hypothetical protein
LVLSYFLSNASSVVQWPAEWNANVENDIVWSWGNLVWESNFTNFGPNWNFVDGCDFSRSHWVECLLMSLQSDAWNPSKLPLFSCFGPFQNPFETMCCWTCTQFQ